MFDFLVKNKKGEIQNYYDIITAETTKIGASNFAKEKAENMIANAIAKSEIVVKGNNEQKQKELYYRLNIAPNDNETGTDFWFKVVKKLLKDGECVICPIKDKFYIAQYYNKDQMILNQRTYKDIVLECGDVTKSINKRFKASDIIHLQYHNEEIRTFQKKMNTSIDNLYDALINMKQSASAPKFKLSMGAQSALGLADKETGKVVTKDEFAKRICDKISEPKATVIALTKGIELDQLKIETTVTSDDIVKMQKEIMSNAAMAYDIPEFVYFGNISEKSDATNEFITFAVNPIAEVLNDSLNAKLVGQEDYIKGEYIKIDLKHFKHVDIIDASTGLDKLRSLGFNFDEIREIAGYDALNTDFSQERVITKNYTNQLGGEEKPI